VGLNADIGAMKRILSLNKTMIDLKILINFLLNSKCKQFFMIKYFTMTIYIVMIITLAILNSIPNNSNNIINGLAVAQMIKSNDANESINGNVKVNATLSNTINTFSVEGTISSLNFNNNSIPNIAIAKKIVISGHWSLYINKGNVSFFEADFIAAPIDGSVSHTHQLVNLKSLDAAPIHLTSNGSTSIFGTADVMMNGINVWKDVKISLVISNGSAITIALDDTDTQHHFTSQPVYGIVERLAF